MRVFDARNVQQVLVPALRAIWAEGVDRESRNGPVKMFPEPVTTVYRQPRERVLFWPARDANPFFHLIESLWMLAGRNDVDTVAKYVTRMRSFSDDGVTFHGAYGHRWRHHFFRDQLAIIAEALKANPEDRRQVLQMWDANVDLARAGKDLPCNLLCTFQINTMNRLDMMVANRSNDMIWGAYGANAVHFSYLQEYMASQIGVAVGSYYQVSANFHAYRTTLDPLQNFEGTARENLDAIDPYARREVAPFPLMTIEPEAWDAELQMFISEPDAIGFRDPFFRRIAKPMVCAHRAFSDREDPRRFTRAMEYLSGMPAENDWRRAAAEWLGRRELAAKIAAERARDDGVAYD